MDYDCLIKGLNVVSKGVNIVYRISRIYDIGYAKVAILTLTRLDQRKTSMINALSNRNLELERENIKLMEENVELKRKFQVKEQFERTDKYRVRLAM